MPGLNKAIKKTLTLLILIYGSASIALALTLPRSGYFKINLFFLTNLPLLSPSLLVLIIFNTFFKAISFLILLFL